MKYFSFLGLTLFICIEAFSATHEIGILYLEEMENNSERTLAYATDGVIYEIDNSNTKLLDQVKFAIEKQVEVEVEIGEFSELNNVLSFRDEIFDNFFL